MAKKITKLQVKQYRLLSKIAMVLNRALEVISIKLDVLEANFKECVSEDGPQICAGMIAEIKSSAERISTEYKAAYRYAYELLSDKKKELADEYLASVTKPPKSEPRLVVTCSELLYFEK